MNGPFQIRLLAEESSVLPGLAEWFVAEWPSYYGKAGPGNALSDLADSMNHDRLPLALVAMGDAGRVMGTAALKATSLGGEVAPGPWLAAMLVGPDHRGRGVGSALVEAIEGAAKRLGYSVLYSSTDSLEHLLIRRGWEEIGATDSLRGAICIYRKILG